MIPNYRIIDRSFENYQTLSNTNINQLELLIQDNVKANFKFIGGFRGAKMKDFSEYSAWIFREDATAKNYSYLIIPIKESYSNFDFVIDSDLINIISDWTDDGWELISILYTQKIKTDIIYYQPYVFIQKLNLNGDYQQNRPIIRSKKPLKKHRSFRSDNKNLEVPVDRNRFSLHKTIPLSFKSSNEKNSLRRKKAHSLQIDDYSKTQQDYEKIKTNPHTHNSLLDD